ncbi:MAG: class I SAM-dependent methyltransferase [Egicoccus sp.]
MNPSLPPSWRDERDRPAEVPAPPTTEDPAFYLPIGEFQGAEYRRNAFAAGTAEEAGALWELAGLSAGTRLLDVGCGDGRHLRALAGRGVVGAGVDVSPALIDAARASEGGTDVEWLVGDARRLATVLGDRMGGYDVAWSLCQGALGTSSVSDPDVVRDLAAAVRAGGVVVCTFFSALFAARHLAPGDAFDPVHLVHHHRAEVRGPDHTRSTFSLWTASYTVRDAARLFADAGLVVERVHGVEPGAYGRRAAGEVGLDDPEILVVGRRH